MIISHQLLLFFSFLANISEDDNQQPSLCVEKTNKFSYCAVKFKPRELNRCFKTKIFCRTKFVSDSTAD